MLRAAESANGAHPEVYAVPLRAAADGATERHARDSITSAKRAAYAKLTRKEVNDVIKKCRSAKNLQVVIITKDTEGLRDALLVTRDVP